MINLLKLLICYYNLVIYIMQNNQVRKKSNYLYMTNLNGNKTLQFVFFTFQQKKLELLVNQIDLSMYTHKYARCNQLIRIFRSRVRLTMRVKHKRKSSIENFYVANVVNLTVPFHFLPNQIEIYQETFFFKINEGQLQCVPSALHILQNK